MSISVFIPTLNESINIRDCIASVAWSDDIVVYDSFSSDATCDIAREMGARVFQKKFEDDESAHRNWAFENIPFKHPWVLYLDADERVPDALRQEIQAIAANPNQPHAAYYVRFKNFFMGRWVKHAMPPVWIPRFYQISKFRYQRKINMTYTIDGTAGYLQHMIDHYTFSKGLNWWLEKHNKYSTLEALEALHVVGSGNIEWRGLFSRDSIIRRRTLKRLSFYLPARGLIKFFYLYILNGAILDGYPGLVYAVIHSFWEYITSLKMKEMLWHQRGRKF